MTTRPGVDDGLVGPLAELRRRVDELEAKTLRRLSAGFPHGTTTQTYTPQLTAATTDPTLGSGSTQQGRYYRTGRWVFVAVRIRFGTSGTDAGSGTYAIDVPINIASDITAAAVGSGQIFDNSTSTRKVVVATRASASTVELNVHDATNSVSSSSPWAWGASDLFQLDLRYEAA